MLDDVRARFEQEAVAGLCDTGRYRCRYFSWGDGPPLVFVHGLCDTARSFVLPIAFLSQHFRCITYELPTGMADGANVSRYRHADLAADLNLLLDHLKIDQCDVFGSSFGSTIALAALGNAPGRFGRAVLQGGFAHRPLAWAEVLLARMARQWPWPMHRLPLRAAILRHAHHHSFGERDPAYWNFFVGQSGVPAMAAVAHRALLLHEVDLRRRLADIHQPVLLICGENDPLVGKACEEVLLTGLPRATRVQIRCCGHLPQFSHPEVLAELTLRFLKPLPCAAS